MAFEEDRERFAMDLTLTASDKQVVAVSARSISETISVSRSPS